MKPVIHGAHIGGHTHFRAWVPGDDRDVLETVVLSIGGGSGKRTDEFWIRVATPAGLARAEAHEGIIASRALLVLERYDPDLLWRWLESIVAACDASDWMHCAEQLGRHFDWEFHNYPQS